ncbi:MAG TPA: hypothetical protein VKX49_11795 [Bryobacteraceae bacterium]|nr:hypothetical protein [Bryobacteraceae bacterium]
MKKTYVVALFMLLFSAVGSRLAAAPVIASVMNAASNLDQRLPSGGISPGSIFIVKGTGLGPATLSIASNAFQSTTLSGTSVKVTVNGTSVDALMYYTSDTQVAALLPSNTPNQSGGPGTITVTYNGQTSAPAPIRNVFNGSLGIFTVDSTGTGPAIVTYADYSLVSPAKAANCGGPSTTCGAANPGDTLILWATGLGPVNGSDAAGDGLGKSIAAPLTVWLGGVQAPVVYQGRSGCCIGEDQIVFTVPDNVPAGCAVPLVVQIGQRASNSTWMPVANGSRTCTPVNPAITAFGVQQLATASSFTLANIELDHLLNNDGSFLDRALAFFAKVSGVPGGIRPFLASYFDNQPLGTCTVTGTSAPGDVLFNNLFANGNITLIDGGPNVTIMGPNGTMTVSAMGDHQTLSPTGAFLSPAVYTVTGSGGKDVGPFTASITIPATPTLISPTKNTLTATRTQGMTLTWTPNGSGGQVEMVLSFYVDQNNASTVVCTAPASAGTFTIPPYALFALPTGAPVINFNFQPGNQTPAYAGTFSATGLSAGLAVSFVDGVAFSNFTLN